MSPLHHRPADPLLERLLAQEGWARALARRLVRDAANADDLVQGAWVAALERPPASDVPPRRRLGAVLRKLAARAWRGELRRGAHAALVARSSGHGEAALAAPEEPAYDLELVLAPAERRPLLVRGRVVDEAREPVLGAWVGLGARSMRTGADGRFELDLGESLAEVPMAKDPDGAWRPRHREDRVCALVAGRLPAEHALPAREELRSREEPLELELVLAGETLALEGRVLDAEGRPLEDVLVSVLDETEFAPSMEGTGESAISMDRSVEELLRGEGRSPPRTARDGSFRVEGLLEREYRLAALDRRTLRHATSAPIPAGASDLRLILPADEALRRVAGRVVSRSGVPLEGVALRAGRSLRAGAAPSWSARRTSDAEGRFDLGLLDPEGLHLQLTGSAIFFELAWTPPAGAALDALEVELSSRRMLQVDLGSRPDLADEFWVLDERGERVDLIQFDGPVMWFPTREPIVAGRSQAVAVEEHARTLVLWKENAEVLRLPLVLEAEGVTIVRP